LLGLCLSKTAIAGAANAIVSGTNSETGSVLVEVPAVVETPATPETPNTPAQPEKIGTQKDKLP